MPSNIEPAAHPIFETASINVSFVSVQAGSLKLHYPITAAACCICIIQQKMQKQWKGRKRLKEKAKMLFFEREKNRCCETGNRKPTVPHYWFTVLHYAKTACSQNENDSFFLNVAL